MSVEWLEMPSCVYDYRYLQIGDKKLCGERKTHLVDHVTDDNRHVDNSYQGIHSSSIEFSLVTNNLIGISVYGFDVYWKCADRKQNCTS